MDDPVQSGPSSANRDPEEATSEDRSAVSHYLTSDRYQKYRTRSAGPNPAVAWYEPRWFWGAPGMPSLLAGPLGLSLITLAFAMLLPIGLEALQEFMPGRPVYTTLMLIVQTLVLPPLVAFGFAVVTAMFWYGSVVLRFAIAVASTLPGCFGFWAAVTLLEGNPQYDFWLGFSVVMFTSLLVAAATTVAVQMWSRWTLSHRRINDGPLPRTGTRSMIELTAIAALGCAIFGSSDTGDFTTGILLFGAISLFTSITITSALIVYFGAAAKPRAALAVGLVFVFAAACCLNGFFATEEYGWDALSMEYVLIGSVSLYGAAISVAVMWLCLRWLKVCGWSCVNRKTVLPVTSQTADPGP